MLLQLGEGRRRHEGDSTSGDMGLDSSFTFPSRSIYADWLGIVVDVYMLVVIHLFRRLHDLMFAEEDISIGMFIAPEKTHLVQ